LTGYENKDFGALAHASENKNDGFQCGAYLLYKHNNDLTFATKYINSQKGEDEHSVVLGTQWKGSADTLIRTTFDTNLTQRSHFSHKMSKNVTLQLNWETNMKQFLPDAPEFKGGYMNYPFKGGLTFKCNC
jgi:hypothetical protein